MFKCVVSVVDLGDLKNVKCSKLHVNWYICVGSRLQSPVSCFDDSKAYVVI